jgi:uncharacterized membrane protein YfcA
VTLCVGAETAVPVLTIAQLLGNLSRMAFGIKQIDWKSVGLFCAAALPLAALGAFGFSVLPKDIVTRCIGGVLVALVLIKVFWKLKFKAGAKTLLIGGAVTGLLSGLAGSGGPIGAAVFLSLGLPPVAYIASEAATATAMHILKTIIYSNLINLNLISLGTGLLMGLAMIAGSFTANRIIKKIEKAKFQKYVAVLLCFVGLYMVIMGA